MNNIINEIKNNDWSSNLVIVIIILAASTLIHLAILGNTTASKGNSSNASLAERIRPVVTLEDIIGTEKTATQTESVQAAAKSPEALYLSACMACHTTGVANAPKLGDNAAWSPRADMGLDGLVQSAIKGKGAMPPNGASSYSADEMRIVIEYILGKASL